MESVAVMQTLAKTKTPAAILRAVSDNPAAGISPLDTNSGTFANKWIENTAEISKHFPAVLKILVS
jgi:nucleoside phosphorylase